MEELEKVIESICNNLAGLNETLAERSRELDRRADFDKEIGEIINEIKSKRIYPLAELNRQNIYV